MAVAGYAQVAQLVEHATENRSVGGSIPPLGTIFPLAEAKKPLKVVSLAEIEARGSAKAPR